MKKLKTCALSIIFIFAINIFTLGCSTDNIGGIVGVGVVYFAYQHYTKKDTVPKEPFSYNNYAEVSYNGLVNILKQNAALANQKLKNQKIKIVGGKIGLIDADGGSFSLNNADYFGSDEVHCEIANAVAKNQLLNMRREQYVDIYGKVTRVGESLGYSVDVDRIEFPGQQSMP